MRIVSAVPSATETLLAWGIEPVACTRFCEQPTLRHIGGTKDPNLVEIIALKPDLVIMCDQENRLEDAEALESAGLAIHVIHLLDIRHNGPEMDRLATEVGKPERIGTCDVGPTGKERSTAHSSDIEEIRAFIPIWKRPWMTINGETYGSTLLDALGVTNIAADLPDRYPELTADQIVALAPDVVLAPTEPYPFAPRHQSLLEQFAPVVFVDGQDLFWWGARAPQAAARLRLVTEALRPFDT
jgi:ABC-type Fe3+-hydroxamate transport system substrate-binding protein